MDAVIKRIHAKGVCEDRYFRPKNPILLAMGLFLHDSGYLFENDPRESG